AAQESEFRYDTLNPPSSDLFSSAEEPTEADKVASKPFQCKIERYTFSCGHMWQALDPCCQDCGYTDDYGDAGEVCIYGEPSITDESKANGECPDCTRTQTSLRHIMAYRRAHTVGLGVKQPTAFKMLRLSVEFSDEDVQKTKAAELKDEGSHGKRKASDDLEHEAQRRKVAGDDEEKEEEPRSTTLWG
ncbi:hypothetical protein LTS18_000609, partial [Coniosporium uncinatum]